MARNRGYLAQVNIIGANAINNITKHVRELSDKSSLLAKVIAEKFCEQAQDNLYQNAQNKVTGNYYDVDRLLDNIYVRKYKNNSYRVAIRDNADKETMYFLEFGTGLIGKENPHKAAAEYGYEYAKNANSYIDPADVLNDEGYYALDNPDMKGWIYFDEKKNRKVFTSGLYPVSYLYDTIQKIENIVAESIEEVGL